jgi:peptide deformylase
MAARRILQLGDPLLRQISAPLPDSPAAGKVLADLRDTLHEFQRSNGFGRGISAVQIGELVRVIYMEFEGRPYCLINPEFDFLSEEKFALWDDCFSFPNLLVWLERSVTVRLHYMDETGASRSLEASGAFSELIQHEMDHLDGILAVDRLLHRNGFCTRKEWLRQDRRPPE